ncbi:HD domain-containing phosphohydrolase [Blastococcus colisei]|uniref:HD domain-containing phosphohydrolase n=1 Tax=Blastococcus colisei TaxID=1564162 RepID=UPI0011504CDA|nr:HD domain-containing phosphohydrolase [Blastococcus colisei]
MGDVRPATRDSIRVSELMATWSIAIDVGMVMPTEFGLRVCSRAVRLAQLMDLDVAEQRRVYYLALLRHIGCTAENSALADYLGDGRIFRAGLGTRDVSDGRALMPYLVQLTVGSRSLAQRPAALFQLLARAGVMKQAGAAVCEVARMLLDRLGFDADLRERLRDDVTMVYERPDGRGFPRGLGGEELSLPAQVVQLAEAATVHLRLVDREGTLAMVCDRRGRAFLPDVADASLLTPVR